MSHTQLTFSGPFWPAFTWPTYSTEKGLNDKERKKQQDDFNDRLKSLRNSLAREELRLTALRDAVRDRGEGVRVLQTARFVSRPNPNIPLDQLQWNKPPGTHAAHAKAAVTLAQCLTRITEIREEIQQLKGSIDAE